MPNNIPNMSKRNTHKTQCKYLTYSLWISLFIKGMMETELGKWFFGDVHFGFDMIFLTTIKDKYKYFVIKHCQVFSLNKRQSRHKHTQKFSLIYTANFVRLTVVGSFIWPNFRILIESKLIDNSLFHTILHCKFHNEFVH